jgi:uncharacterized protein YegP (UPF0339 family)
MSSVHEPDEDRGRIEIYREVGNYRFRVVCGTDALLLVSDDYASLESARKDIDMIRHGGSQLRACMSADGLFYFACIAPSGERLAASPMFVIPSERDAAQSRVGLLVLEGLGVGTIQCP